MCWIWLYFFHLFIYESNPVNGSPTVLFSFICGPIIPKCTHISCRYYEFVFSSFLCVGKIRLSMCNVSLSPFHLSSPSLCIDVMVGRIMKKMVGKAWMSEARRGCHLSFHSGFSVEHHGCQYHRSATCCHAAELRCPKESAPTLPIPDRRNNNGRI